MTPTIYEMEPIGLDNAREATAAHHYCSTVCRDRAVRVFRNDKVDIDILNEPTADICEGEVCDYCGNELTS